MCVCVYIYIHTHTRTRTRNITLETRFFSCSIPHRFSCFFSFQQALRLSQYKGQLQAACQAGAEICASNKNLRRLTSVCAYPVLCYITYVTCACVRPVAAVCLTLQPFTQEVLGEDLGLETDYCEFSWFSSVIPGTVPVLRYFEHHNFVAHLYNFLAHVCNFLAHSV